MEARTKGRFRWTIRIRKGVCSAVINFNSGTNGMLKIYEKLGMTCGYYTRQFCFIKDNRRVKKMGVKMSTDGKSDRKRKRSIKKRFQVLSEDAEGETYASGQF